MPDINFTYEEGSEKAAAAKGILSNIVEDTSKALEQLDHLLNTLRSKLNPVLRDGDSIPANPETSPQEERGVSPLARQAQESLRLVYSMQSRVKSIAEDLVV